MAQTLSDDGYSFLEGWEELRLTPYLDAGNKWTVGWGHLMHDGDDKNSPITREVALNLLMFDTHSAISDVVELTTIPLKQREFDALVIFVYNVGHTQFKTSHLLSYVNAGATMAASGEFPKWDHVHGVEVNGLLKRRLAEQSIFLNGDYRGRP